MPNWLNVVTDDGHSGVVTDLLQLLGEISESVLSHSSLRGETGDGPDANLNAGEELLAAHIPDALVGQSLLLGAASVLQFRRRKDTPTHFHHAKRFMLGVGGYYQFLFNNDQVEYLLEIVRPNSWTYGSLLKSALRIRLLISRSRSGAERAVALIMVDVCMSVSFLMQRWPATILQTSKGR